jgi:hypothetical protein
MENPTTPDSLNLLAPVAEILEKVAEVSGKPVIFRPAPEQQVPATSKVARKRMPFHIIKYQPQMVSQINHLTAHECGHILRTVQADPSVRVVPASNTHTRAIATTQLKTELSHLPESLREQMLDLWVGGIIMQITSLPACARIENWIHSQYPALRNEQRTFLEKDVKKTILGVSKPFERATPKTIFRISNSITYAYLRGIEPVTGEDLRKHFSGRPDVVRLGMKLYSSLQKEDTGFEGDLRVTKDWATILKIADWFTWLNFEEMPEAYYSDV